MHAGTHAHARRPFRRRAVAGGIWLGVLLLVAGCASPPPPVTLTPGERMELHNRSLDQLLLAARSDMDVVSCNAIEALVQIAPRDGLPAFRQALQSTAPPVRYAGLVALGTLRDKASLPKIAAAANDENIHVQLAAAYAACRCGKDGYARVLMNALNASPEPMVRSDAASLLGRLSDPRAGKWLQAALREPTNEKERPVLLAIYGALAQLGHTDALRELIRYSQGDAASRADALLLLADLGNPEARDALRFRLLSSSEDYVEARLIAARGLGKLGYRDGYELAMKHLNYADPNTKPDPDNPDRTFPIRSMAIHALGEIGDIQAVPALRQIAADKSDPRLQVAASYAICKILAKDVQPTRR